MPSATPVESETAVLVSKNLKLETELKAIKEDYKSVVNKYDKASREINTLESQLKVKVEPIKAL